MRLLLHVTYTWLNDCIADNNYYRAKRTAGYLHVSNVIFIVTYTSALKTRAHGRRSALKTKTRDSVWSFRISVYFYVYKVAMRTHSRSLVATIITKILTANGDFLTSVKAHKSRRKEFDLVCFQRRIKMAINIMT